MLNISNTIKRLRIKKHYTQDEIAEICKVSRQAVAKWESGSNLPDIEKLVILSQVFEVSVDELITGNERPVLISDRINRKNSNTENERIVNQALKRAISYEDPVDALNHFISYIGKQIGCDRLYIFEQNPDGSYKNSYEWCNKGISPQIEYLQSIPLEDMSVWLDKFASEEFIFIENIEDISDSEPVVYRWIKPQGVQSLLVYPLFGGRAFLGADNPAPAFILQTRYLLEIMICFVENMIKNRDLKQELQRTVLQNDHFVRVSRGVCYQLNIDSGVLQYDMSQAEEQGYSFKVNTLSELEELASLHPEFHDHLMIDGIQKVIESKGNVSIEFISYKKNQEIRWNRLSISPFIDSNGKVLRLYGVLQDVSEEHHIVEQYNKYIFHLSGGLHICYLSSPIHLDFVSDSLCEVAGYDRAEFTKVVGSKYTNIIYKEDRAIFRRHVQRLSAAPGVDSCEYRIVKKDGSIVQVLDTMESVADSSGITYGYAYILEKSDLAAMLNMVEEKDKKHIELINRQYEVLAALGKDYLNVFRVWLDEDKAQIINLNGYVVKGMDKNSAEYIPYFRFCKQYIQDRVFADDQQKMLEAMHPDTIRKAFSAGEEYTVVYRVNDNGEIHFYQLRYIRLNNMENTDEISFVAGFRNVDKLIEEEKAQNEKLQNRLKIINAILQTFTMGYFIDYENDTFTELSNTRKTMTEIIGENGVFSETLRRWESSFADKEAFGIIHDFLAPESLDKRLDNQNFMSVQVFVKGCGWYELYMHVVECDKCGKAISCIVAAKDISKERETLKLAYLDALTGVMNRNAFERDFCAIDECTDSVGFIFCDINNLKRTNDTYGHSKGDRLLVDFSDLVKQFFSVDCIYRVGGDEFICMIGRIEQNKFMTRVGEFVQTVTKCGNIVAVGAAYGSVKKKESLLREAENKMYEMKYKCQ